MGIHFTQVPTRCCGFALISLDHQLNPLESESCVTLFPYFSAFVVFMFPFHAKPHMKISLAICLSVLLLPLVGYAANKNQRSNSANVSQNQTQQAAQPAIALQSNPPTSHTQSSEHDTTPESTRWRCQFYLPFASVVVSFATFIVVWRQVATLRQIERAWLMVDIERIPGYPTRMISETAISGESQGKQSTVCVTLTYRNCGQTPAWITER